MSTEAFLKTHTQHGSTDPYSTRRNSAAVAYDWQQRLSLKETLDIQHICGPLLLRVGYDKVEVCMWISRQRPSILLCYNRWGAIDSFLLLGMHMGTRSLSAQRCIASCRLYNSRQQKPSAVWDAFLSVVFQKYIALLRRTHNSFSKMDI